MSALPKRPRPRRSYAIQLPRIVTRFRMMFSSMARAGTLFLTLPAEGWRARNGLRGESA